MRKIKIAQIGTSAASHGNQIFLNLNKQTDIFDVVGYALPENEREKFKNHMWAFEGSCEMTVSEILKNPEIEAITIETEEIYLTKYASLAAEHGKHIHMEKPGGTNLAEFEKMIETAKKNKTVFHTGYMYRYNPSARELIERIKNGELGDIISIEAQMNGCYHTIDRRYLKNFPGGMMFFLGGHLVDFIMQIKGKPEKVVPLNCSTGTYGAEVEDFGMAALCYKDGNCLVKTAADEVGARRHLIVSGTKATAVIDPVELGPEDALSSTLTQHTKTGITYETKTKESENFDRYGKMLASFGEIVRGERENQFDYDYEFMLYKTLLACCGR